MVNKITFIFFSDKRINYNIYRYKGNKSVLVKKKKLLIFIVHYSYCLSKNSPIVSRSMEHLVVY